MGIKGTIQIPDKKKKTDYTKRPHETTSILCENVTFDFTSVREYYDIAREIAVNNIREEYEENQEIEEADILDAIDSGEIEDESEYARKYDKPFNETDFLAKIKSETNKLMLAAAEIPRNVVVTVKGDVNPSEFDRNALLSLISEKYGFTAIDIEKQKAPSYTAILKQNTFDNIGKMMNDNDYKTFLHLKDNLKNYSANNIAMVYGQYPDAEAVKTLKAWGKAERSVNSGEKGIMIWSPVITEMKTEKAVDKYIENHDWIYDTDQKKTDKKKELMDDIAKYGSASELSGYKPMYVYDVKQTHSRDPEHDNLEEFIRLDKPLNERMDNSSQINTIIYDVIEKGGFIAQTNKGDSEGMYQTIKAYCDAVMSESPESVSGIKSNIPSQGKLAELETLVAAGLICENIGIPDALDKVQFEMTKLLDIGDAFSSEKAFKNAVEGGGRHDLFKKAFDRGSALSAQFGKEFDKEYEALGKPKDKKKEFEMDR